MTYEEQLQQPEWKALRQSIFERYLYMCQVCMSSRSLQAHHKQYIPGRMAWEYHPRYLITLCADCHKNWHAENKAKVEVEDPMLSSAYRIQDSLQSLKFLSSAKTLY